MTDEREFAHIGLTHTNGDRCIWLDGVWFVPLDAGGGGHECPHDHPQDLHNDVPRGLGKRRLSKTNAIAQVEVSIIGHHLRAEDVQAGDEIMTPEYAGVVSMVDVFDLNSSKGVPPSQWPCLRIFVADQGGIARFPNELVQVTRAKRIVPADADGEPLAMPACGCCAVTVGSATSHEFNWQTGYCACGWAGPAIDDVPAAHAAHVAEPLNRPGTTNPLDARGGQPMSLKTLTCIEAACDDCGSACWDDSDYGTPHFKTAEDAVEELVKHHEWAITDDAQLCRHCADTRLCEAEGHQWGEWIEPHKGVFAGTRQRFCARDYCYEYEQEPLTRPGTADGESDG